MTATGAVVADTTPLNYLILIERTRILNALFCEVIIPEAVLTELRHPKAPEEVTRWPQSPPSWLRHFLGPVPRAVNSRIPILAVLLAQNPDRW